MKRIANIVFLISVAISLYGQQVVLDSCLADAIQHYPTAGQGANIEKSGDLAKDLLKTRYYPQINAYAQASYQEPTLSVDIPTEGLPIQLDFPAPPNDQYNFYVDVQQMIYDGGRVQTAIEMEENKSNQDVLKHQMQMHKVKQEVVNIYFMILLEDQKMNRLQLMKHELDKRITNAESLVEAGVVLKSDLENLRATALQLQQQMISSRAGRQALTRSLHWYTGKTYDTATVFTLPDHQLRFNDSLIRVEQALFLKKKEQINLMQNLEQSKRKPGLYAFSQVGYGNPGLNMLNDAFAPYYRVGLTFSWNIYDWKQSQRQQQILTWQQENIAMSEHEFDMQTTIAIDQALSEIKALQEVIATGKEIIEKLSVLEATAASRFENGSINATEYLVQNNKKQMALLNNEMNQIKLMQAWINLQLVKGQL